MRPFFVLFICFLCYNLLCPFLGTAACLPPALVGLRQAAIFPKRAAWACPPPLRGFAFALGIWRPLWMAGVPGPASASRGERPLGVGRPVLRGKKAKSGKRHRKGRVAAFPLARMRLRRGRCAGRHDFLAHALKLFISLSAPFVSSIIRSNTCSA